MYKVFINDKVICFTEERIDQLKHSNSLVLSFFDAQLAIIIIDLLEKDPKLQTIFIYTKDINKAFEIFKSHFKLIKAAGGIVSNEEGKILFIHRLGKWDLPKGKIEKNEGIEEAAVREVEEECGINGLQIQRLVKETFHVYDIKEKVVLKQTYWFSMRTNFSGILTPQLEENIKEARWMDNNEINDIVLSNTYQSIKDLLKTVIS